MSSLPASLINEEANAMASGRPRIKRAVIRVVGLLAVGAVAVAVLRGRVPDLRDVLPTLRGADPGWLALAVAAQLASIEMFARQQRSLLRAFGVSLSAGRSRAITYARTAISVTMPAGSVVSAGFAFAQWRARGATRGVATAVMVLSGIASFAGLAGLYLVGSGAAVAVRPAALGAASPPILAAAGCLGAAVLLAALIRRARRISPTPRTTISPAAPPPTRSALRPWSMDGLRSAAVLTRRAAAAIPRRHALAALAFAAVNWLTDLICLAITARALQVRLGLVPVAGVYLAVQIVRQIPLTPGGVGLIETSLLAGLVAAGAGNTDASAVVLTYRLLSCWLIVPIGVATWAALRRLGPPAPAQPTLIHAAPMVPPPVSAMRHTAVQAGNGGARGCHACDTEIEAA
jgi:uncharacterized membrane protein YbhN (UPF0104 family)